MRRIFRTFSGKIIGSYSLHTFRCNLEPAIRTISNTLIERTIWTLSDTILARTYRLLFGTIMGRTLNTFRSNLECVVRTISNKLIERFPVQSWNLHFPIAPIWRLCYQDLDFFFSFSKYQWNLIKLCAFSVEKKMSGCFSGEQFAFCHKTPKQCIKYLNICRDLIRCVTKWRLAFCWNLLWLELIYEMSFTFIEIRITIISIGYAGSFCWLDSQYSPDKK